MSTLNIMSLAAFLEDTQENFNEIANDGTPEEAKRELVFDAYLNIEDLIDELKKLQTGMRKKFNLTKKIIEEYAKEQGDEPSADDGKE